jgi:hypothetical protein
MSGSRLPWLTFGVLAILFGALLAGTALRSLPFSLPPCPMKTHLGIPCASCGLTRCAMALAGGHWAEAFHWHPVFVILGLLSPIIIVWDLHRAWKGSRYPSLPDSLALRLSVGALLAGTWILQIARGI